MLSDGEFRISNFEFETRLVYYIYSKRVWLQCDLMRFVDTIRALAYHHLTEKRFEFVTSVKPLYILLPYIIVLATEWKFEPDFAITIFCRVIPCGTPICYT